MNNGIHHNYGREAARYIEGNRDFGKQSFRSFFSQIRVVLSTHLWHNIPNSYFENVINETRLDSKKNQF